MVRSNASANLNVNYGSTSSAPPPYDPSSGLPQHNDNRPSSAYPSSNSHFGPLGILKIVTQWMKSRSFLVLLTVLVTVGLCMHAMPVTYCDSPLDRGVRQRIRERWNKELLEHQQQVSKREFIQSQWKWEDERHAELVREWEYERVQHESELEEREHREEEEHKHRLAARRRNWQYEQIRHDLELKERARREDEERKRLDLFWGHLEAHQCKTFGAREYTAVLMNLPIEWGWVLGVEACKVTPLEIHGIRLMPKSCEFRGNGIVVGLWEVDQFEPDCKPLWIWYKDKGCAANGSGKKVIEQYLENIPSGGDWREFCATAPARFDEMQFIGAHWCTPANNGAWGYWEIDDANC